MKLIWQSTGESPFGSITIKLWPTIRSQTDTEDEVLETAFEELSEKIEGVLEGLEEDRFTAWVTS